MPPTPGKQDVGTVPPLGEHPGSVLDITHEIQLYLRLPLAPRTCVEATREATWVLKRTKHLPND